jgi:hypothetical protein
MAAGVSTRLWEVSDLVALLEETESQKAAQDHSMKPHVTYIRTGNAVEILPTTAALMYFGKRWPAAQGSGWSMGADAFKQLRRDNPKVDFVEVESK